MSRQLNHLQGDAALAAFLRADRRPPLLLLHSGRRHPRWASRSLLARPRAWFRYFADGRSELTDVATGRPLQQAGGLTHRLWRDVRAMLYDPALAGPWIGYFGYGVNRFVEPGKLARRGDDRGWPIVELGWCPEITRFPPPHQATPPEPAPDRAAPPLSRSRVPAELSDFTRAAYEAAVHRVLDYIAAGDVFQVNLAQRFTTTCHGDPRQLYHRLATISPAWYGAHLELPPLDPSPRRRHLLSTSPELFLHLENNHVITRPIKGTRPASADPAELAHSEKDAAELHMIVDLMRNDLGRVCDYGSVRVTQPRTIESHPTVHHGVATVEGRLHPSRDVVDLLRATLPGGSVTGAPKVRAMQIIDELEPHPRGPYCGAIGMISRRGLTLNIAIRTLALTPTEEAHRYVADFWAGGGIVADSDPAAEYEETLDKAAAVWAAVADNP